MRDKSHNEQIESRLSQVRSQRKLKSVSIEGKPTFQLNNIRDKSHNEQIERWAEFCRKNPAEFKRRLKPLIDSQIIMSRRFYKKLSETEEGKKILIRLKSERLRNNL